MGKPNKSCWLQNLLHHRSWQEPLPRPWPGLCSSRRQTSAARRKAGGSRSTRLSCEDPGPQTAGDQQSDLDSCGQMFALREAAHPGSGTPRQGNRWSKLAQPPRYRPYRCGLDTEMFFSTKLAPRSQSRAGGLMRAAWVPVAPNQETNLPSSGCTHSCLLSPRQDQQTALFSPALRLNRDAKCIKRLTDVPDQHKHAPGTREATQPRSTPGLFPWRGWFVGPVTPPYSKRLVGWRIRPIVSPGPFYYRSLSQFQPHHHCRSQNVLLRS